MKELHQPEEGTIFQAAEQKIIDIDAALDWIFRQQCALAGKGSRAMGEIPSLPDGMRRIPDDW